MNLHRVYKTSIMLGLSLSCATLYSQPKKTTFGFKGGINQSEINAKELDGTKSRYSGTELYRGFFADTRISNNFKLGNELLFSFTDDYNPGAAASLNAGYRLQSKNGFMLRANASAIYLDKLITPIPGLAIGYNFK